MSRASLPIEPLRAIAAAQADRHADTEATGGFTQRLFADMIGMTDRSVTRWMQDGRIPWSSADEAAVALGLHPALVWGDAWWDVKGDLAEIEAEVHAELMDAIAAEGLEGDL